MHSSCQGWERIESILLQPFPSSESPTQTRLTEENVRKKNKQKNFSLLWIFEVHALERLMEKLQSQLLLEFIDAREMQETFTLLPHPKSWNKLEVYFEDA